jgi:hypothetical protein
MEVGDEAACGAAPPASSGGDLPAELDDLINHPVHGQALLPAELDEVREYVGVSCGSTRAAGRRTCRWRVEDTPTAAEEDGAILSLC